MGIVQLIAALLFSQAGNISEQNQLQSIESIHSRVCSEMLHWSDGSLHEPKHIDNDGSSGG